MGMVKGVLIEGHHPWEVREAAMCILVGKAFKAEGTVSQPKGFKEGDYFSKARKPEYMEQRE